MIGISGLWCHGENETPTILSVFLRTLNSYLNEETESQRAALTRLVHESVIDRVTVSVDQHPSFQGAHAVVEAVLALPRHEIRVIELDPASVRESRSNDSVFFSGTLAVSDSQSGDLHAFGISFNGELTRQDGFKLARLHLGSPDYKLPEARP